MSKTIRGLILSAVTLSAALSGCGAPPAAESPVAESGQGLNQAGQVAKQLAPILAQGGARSQVRALLSKAARNQVDYEEIRGVMGGATLPAGSRLVVSAPLGIEGMGEAPLVTFVPDLPEADVRELTYFDGTGRSFTLPVAERPSQPVLVVGPDELLPEGLLADQGGIAPLATKRLVVGRVLIRNDHEPWYKGDPEIYARCTFPVGSPIILDLPEVNSENAWYTINRVLGYFSESNGNPASCGLFESDGITDGNDSLGTSLRWWANPYGTVSITDGSFTLNP